MCFDRKEFKRNVTGSVAYAPLFTVGYIRFFKTSSMENRYKNLILSSDTSRRDVSNGVRVAYVNFYHKWVPYDKVKDFIEVTTIP